MIKISTSCRFNPKSNRGVSIIPPPLNVQISLKRVTQTQQRRSVTLRYLSSKISGSQQFFMAEMTNCNVERKKKRVGYRFVPESNHPQASHTSPFFVVCFFIAIIAGPRFVISFVGFSPNRL